MKIKTGDLVRVLAGKDKGKQGKVLQVFPKLQKVVIEGLNLNTRHLKSRRSDQPGQKIEFPAPVHQSNVAIVSPKSGKVGRVGWKFIEKDGKRTKLRVMRAKGSAEDID